MRIQLSDHFTYKRLFRFVLSPILMMIFISIYGVVDGFFVSNFVGDIPFSAINLIFPFIMVIGGMGFMVGTGGSALVAKLLGEKKKDEAQKVFTMMVLFTVLFGISLTILALVFLKPICVLLKATESMMDYCVTYGTIVISFTTAFMLQNVFQAFLTTAEKPKMGLFVTLAAGITNMILDPLFIIGFKWGLAGAAFATGIGQFIGAIIPFVYFLRPNNSLLRIRGTKIKMNYILRACANGSSELMSNISSSIVAMIFNYQLLKYYQEAGVASYGVIMYVSFIFISIAIGYSIGVSPIVGFNYGAKNTNELKNVFKKSILIMGITGLILFVIAETLAYPLALIFVSYDENLLTLTTHGLRLYSFVFLFSCLNIFASGFFTALNNGLISAIISFTRTLVLQCSCAIVLPLIFGGDALWYACFIAEIGAITLSTIFLITNRKKYQYI